MKSIYVQALVIHNTDVKLSVGFSLATSLSALLDREGIQFQVCNVHCNDYRLSFLIRSELGNAWTKDSVIQYAVT